MCCGTHFADWRKEFEGLFPEVSGKMHSAYGSSHPCMMANCDDKDPNRGYARKDTCQNCLNKIKTHSKFRTPQIKPMDMSRFHADNYPAFDKNPLKPELIEELKIHMVDNGASIPYTDVVIDCSGSMGADMGGTNRVMFTMNLLKVLLGIGHVNNDTVVHGFSARYRGSVPLGMLDDDIVNLMFRPDGGTDFREGIKHVTNLGSTLAILDMWSEGDLKPSYMTPYDFIFYGV